MFAVHRDDLRTPVFRLVHHQFSGTHQCFLIGQRNALFCPDRSQRGFQPHHAYHGGHYRIRFRQHGGFRQRVCTGQYLYRRVLQTDFQLCRGGFLRHDCQSGLKFPALGLHPLHIGIGGQRRHTQPQLLRYIQRLTADGAGGAKY